MPTARHWTDAERKTLETMIKEGHTFRNIGHALGLPRNVIVNASRRFKVKQPEKVSTVDRLLALCKDGVSGAEACKKLKLSRSRLNRIVQNLVADGLLFRGGSLRRPNLFINKQEAEAFRAEYLEQRAEKIRKRAAEERIRRAERMGRPAPQPRTLRPKNALQPKQPVYAIKPSKPKAAPMPTKVIWPESVKVTVIPTPPSRFAFEPPEGWRGQITHDWMDRRLSQTNTRRQAND